MGKTSPLYFIAGAYAMEQLEPGARDPGGSADFFGCPRENKFSSSQALEKGL
jgi:hypothetical protein